MVQKVLRQVGVHDGMFHADEVSACALLVLFNCVDEDKIIRTRDPLVLATCEYVCDVGGVYDPKLKLFDHHQVSYQGEMSSAGMILTYLKENQIIDSEEYDLFYTSIIKGVDDHDNGRSPQLSGICTFSHVIANFVPTAYASSPQEQDHQFFEAFKFALGHFRRFHQRFLYNRASRQTVKEAMDKKTLCLMFDKAIPWLENFFALGGKQHRALFVMMPSGSHWKLRGIPPDLDHRMAVRVPLPKEWAGLLEKDLQERSGISGGIFCHKGRFISVWETKEAALEALRIVMKLEGIQDDNVI